MFIKKASNVSEKYFCFSAFLLVVHLLSFILLLILLLIVIVVLHRLLLISAVLVARSAGGAASGPALPAVHAAGSLTASCASAPAVRSDAGACFRHQTT